MAPRNPAAFLVPGVVTVCLFATTQGKQLWSSQPAVTSDFIRTAYLLGNGRLGGKPQGLPLGDSCKALTGLAMPLGGVGSDYVNLNIDSLWSGGPFENLVRQTKTPSYLRKRHRIVSNNIQNYDGGNPQGSIVPLVQALQQTIFAQGWGGKGSDCPR